MNRHGTDRTRDIDDAAADVVSAQADMDAIRTVEQILAAASDQIAAISYRLKFRIAAINEVSDYLTDAGSDVLSAGYEAAQDERDDALDRHNDAVLADDTF